jgi:hypothetical protein
VKQAVRMRDDRTGSEYYPVFGNNAEFVDSANREVTN